MSLSDKYIFHFKKEVQTINYVGFVAFDFVDVEKGQTRVCPFTLRICKNDNGTLTLDLILLK